MNADTVLIVCNYLLTDVCDTSNAKDLRAFKLVCRLYYKWITGYNLSISYVVKKRSIKFDCIYYRYIDYINMSSPSLVDVEIKTKKTKVFRSAQAHNVLIAKTRRFYVINCVINSKLLTLFARLSDFKIRYSIEGLYHISNLIVKSCPEYLDIDDYLIEYEFPSSIIVNDNYVRAQLILNVDNQNYPLYLIISDALLQYIPL